MRVNVVSDVHDRAEDLTRAGAGADALICLGDLILFMDYHQHEAGIMGELFGGPAVSRLIELRTQGRYAEAKEHSTALWDTLDAEVADRRGLIDAQIRRQYAAMFAAFPDPTYITYGNVDVPWLLQEQLRPGVTLLDGETTTIGGATFGFVGGGLRTPQRTPYELDDAEYAAKVEAVGAVDVLCSHIPPDIPDLLYDVEAHKHERGSADLLRLIEDTQPRYALFGHVHQPLAARWRVGRTECINVGHFRARRRPYRLEL